MTAFGFPLRMLSRDERYQGNKEITTVKYHCTLEVLLMRLSSMRIRPLNDDLWCRIYTSIGSTPLSTHDETKNPVLLHQAQGPAIPFRAART